MTNIEKLYEELIEELRETDNKIISHLRIQNQQLKNRVIELEETISGQYEDAVGEDI